MSMSDIRRGIRAKWEISPTDKAHNLPDNRKVRHSARAEVRRLTGSVEELELDDDTDDLE